MSPNLEQLRAEVKHLTRELGELLLFIPPTRQPVLFAQWREQRAAAGSTDTPAAERRWKLSSRRPNSHFELFANSLRRRKISSTSATSRRCCASVGEWTKQSSMYTNAHRPSGPDAPGTPPRIADVASWPNPTVRAWFMTRISSDDDP